MRVRFIRTPFVQNLWSTVSQRETNSVFSVGYQAVERYGKLKLEDDPSGNDLGTVPRDTRALSRARNGADFQTGAIACSTVM
jgi:hypothetical protein